MSYQARRPDVGAARGSTAVPPGPWRSVDGDAAYVQDSKRTQQLVEKIQQAAADIQREAAALATTSTCAGGKQRVSEAMKAARANQEEVKRILENLPVSGGGGVSEANHRRLMQSKLAEALDGAYTAVRDASRKYEAAEQQRRERDAAAAAAVLSAGVELGAMDADAGPGARQGSQAVAQELDDVPLSQVETHAAIAREYAQEASQLEANVRMVNQVVADMARITVAQGEQVDNVLSFMEEASQSSQAANQQLVQSNQYQQRGTKRLLQLVALAILLVGLIVVVVLLKHS